MSVKPAPRFQVTRAYAWLGLLLMLSIAAGMLLKPDRAGATAHWADQRGLMQALWLNDFCLTTESRHLRHLSTPEWMGVFQDYPGFHDHFPASGFLPPGPVWLPPPHAPTD